MKTILWIDDDEGLLDASVDLFREYGFKLLTATNTVRALSILRRQRLDGVLLDVRLERSGENGLELLQELRHLYPTLKVVIFTAYPNYVDHVIAQRLGASFYFENLWKMIPVDPDMLRAFFDALHQIFEAGLARPTAAPRLGAPTPLSVFCSYSHRDERLRDKLETHLAGLKREGMISTWHDRRIGAGREWAREIDERLNTADIILLLVSANFMASDYSNDVEIRKALKQHKAGGARVIPIILQPVDWQSAPFGKLQALPSDGKPVTRWTNREAAFLNIAQGIRKVIEEVRGLYS